MVAKVSSPAAVQLLHEGAVALSRIEATGVRVDRDYLLKTIAESEEKIRQTEDEMRKDKDVYPLWRKRFGDKTNLGSRPQLAEVLHGVMKYDVKEVTAKTGRARVSKDTLDEIDLPFVAKFLSVESAKKALGTYLLGVRQEMVMHADGTWFLHPIYNLHTTSTYRSSCDHPNFQNQPKRNEDQARTVRQTYLPLPGHMLVEFDFSQLEVRVSACYNKDPALMRYITDKSTDMHTDTAYELFCLSPKDMKRDKKAFKKTVRDSAKNQFVFPEFYGSVFFNCAANIWKSMRMKGWTVPGTDTPLIDHLRKKGIKERGESVSHWDTDKALAGTGNRTGRIETRPGTFMNHCRKVEESLWNKRFKVYTKWKREWYDLYRRRGWFEMHTGFVVSTYHKRNDVINYPIQGSAFHCLLWCIIRMDRWLRKYKMLSRIIGQVHDSMLCSVHPKELQDFLHAAHHTMTVALPRHWKWINVPLEAEADVGEVDGSWYGVKPWQETNGNWGPAA